MEEYQIKPKQILVSVARELNSLLSELQESSKNEVFVGKASGVIEIKILEVLSQI